MSPFEIMEKFSPDLLSNLSSAMTWLEQMIQTAPEQKNKLLDVSVQDKRKERVKKTLVLCKDICSRVELMHSAKLIEHSLNGYDHSSQEISLLLESINIELKQGLYLKIPSHRAKFWENTEIVSEKIKVSFPNVAMELIDAATAYSLSLNTACVFHAMRAAEIGLRCVASALTVTFPHGNLELEQWLTIIKQIESKIKSLDDLPKSTQKSEDQNFYGQAALQFRYFKDGFRIRVTHALASFSEAQALALFNHTCEFFEVLASRLKEEA